MVRRINMTCKDCNQFKPTYPGKGYCKLWDDYVKENDSCEEWEE